MLCAAVLSTMVLSHPVDMVIGKYSVRLHLALGNLARFLFGRSGQVWPRISNSDTLRHILQVCVVGGAGGIGQPLSMLMAMDPNVPISIIQRAKDCSKLDSTVEIPRFPSFACMLQPQTSGDVGHVVCFSFKCLVARPAGLDAGHGSGRGCCSRPVAFEHEV